MTIPGVNPPDPDDPKGMAFVMAAGFPDPRPGQPNQQLVLVQCWNLWSEQAHAMGLRYHPELATKWVVGGGQFSCGELVDEKPHEPSFEESAAEFLEHLAGTDPDMADVLRKVRDAGSSEEREEVAGQLFKDAQKLMQMMKYVSGDVQ